MIMNTNNIKARYFIAACNDTYNKYSMINPRQLPNAIDRAFSMGNFQGFTNDHGYRDWLKNNLTIEEVREICFAINGDDTMYVDQSIGDQIVEKLYPSVERSPRLR